MIKQRINFVRMAVAVITAAAVCAFTTACNFGNSDEKPKEDMVEVTFVAGWTDDEAVWDEDGSVVVKKTVKVPFGSNGYNLIPGTENLINKKGDAYKQLGWYKEEGDHLAEYEYSFTIPIVREIVLVMKWGNEATHSVTFNANGGQWADATEEKTIKVDFGNEIVSPEGASRQRSDSGSDYVLSGWYLDKECTREFNLKEKLYEDKTVYAYWTDFKGTWQEFLQKYSSETPPQAEISICIVDDAVETNLGIPVNVKENLNSGSKITLDLRKASTVKEIAEEGFKDLVTLDTVKLPLGLEKINKLGFNNCYALVNIVFPSSLKEIGSSAFLDCDSLVQVNIPEGCVYIANRAFAGIDGLRYVYLPSTIGLLDIFVFFESFINFQDEGDLIIYNGTKSMFDKINSENTEGEGGEKEVGVKHLEGYLKTDKLYIHHD